MPPYDSTSHRPPPTASATTLESLGRPSDGFCRVARCRRWSPPIRPPDFRCVKPRHAAARSPHRASWRTSTSINSGGSRRRQAEDSRQRFCANRTSDVARSKHARAGASPRAATAIYITEVDDFSQVVYSEILDDERKGTAADFWTSANNFFASLGVKVSAVMTENGSCYRSHAFADPLRPEIKHRRTGPYRTQTNGKVERANRTLITEWVYAQAARGMELTQIPPSLAYLEFQHNDRT